MTRSLVIINPHAGSGRALAVWRQHRTQIEQALGPLEAVETRCQLEVPQVLQDAASRGIDRLISIGGDGTNFHSVNALIRHNRAHPQQPLSYATIPAGTGRDWSRGVAMPLDVRQAIDWIASARPRTVDVGCARLDGVEHLFLNASSVGISSTVVTHVEAGNKGNRLTFLRAILSAMMEYREISLRIVVEGEEWWHGKVYLAAFTNGRFFGQGLKVSPDAAIDDGLLEVTTAGNLTLPLVMRLLLQMYRGAHIYDPRVHRRQGRSVVVSSTDGSPVRLDLDGEGFSAHEVCYSVLPHVLTMYT